jgi:two-component system chemotaxis response regulator CheY
MRILIIDDEQVARARMNSLLSHWGLCETAENGNKALAMFARAVDEGQPYDLITFDIMLPDINGLELLRAVTEKETALGFRSRKIMVSADGNTENVLQSAPDCDSFIVKPVSLEILKKKMHSIWH